MKLKKLTKKIEKYGTEKYTAGYNIGFDDGILDGSDLAFIDGTEAEQSRIQTVLDMHIQWAMESGKGSEAIMLKRVKEMLTPVVILEDNDTF